MCLFKGCQKLNFFTPVRSWNVVVKTRFAKALFLVFSTLENRMINGFEKDCFVPAWNTRLQCAYNRKRFEAARWTVAILGRRFCIISFGHHLRIADRILVGAELIRVSYEPKLLVFSGFDGHVDFSI